MNITLTCRLGLLTSTAISFSPASLFAAGESGFWLDPSDFSTMWQDSQGVTPVTATGQTVGLLLDKSIGTRTQVFDDANVTFGGTAGYSSRVSPGVYEYARNASGNGTVLFGGLTAGKTYLVSLQLSAYAGDIPDITAVRADYFNAVSGILRPLTSTAGTYTFFFLADGAFFRISAGGPGVGGTISNVSILEVPGNHFLQSTAAKRPILGVEPTGGRRNLLRYTEQFDNAAWTKSNTTVTANAAVAPDGATTADKIIETAGTSIKAVGQTGVTVPASSTVTYRVWAKAAERSIITLRCDDGTNGAGKNFNLSTGVVGNTVSVGSGISVSASSISAADAEGFRLCTVTILLSSATTVNARLDIRTSDTTVWALNYAGDGTSGLYLWGAQLELGSTATDYQRVTDQWNVTEAGVTPCYYLQGDGTDDVLNSVVAVDPLGADKSQGFIGVYMISNAVSTFPMGTGPSPASGGVSAPSNPGSWGIRMPSGTGSAVTAWPFQGTTRIAPTFLTSTLTKYVLSGLMDIPAPSIVVRQNAAEVVNSTASVGTGTFLPYTSFVLATATGSFSGRVYQVVCRFGPNLTADQITQTENFVAIKTGFFAPHITGVPTIS